MDGTTKYIKDDPGRLRRGRVALALVILCGLLAPASAWAASSPLPFAMPSSSTLRGSSKMVFAHYIPQYVISQDNRPADQDIYTQYLNPTAWAEPTRRSAATCATARCRAPRWPETGR